MSSRSSSAIHLRPAPPRFRQFTQTAAFQQLRIAVLLPCYNEAQTIAEVVRSFKAQLPAADIYVYDNNSTDNTAAIARDSGAIVRRESRQGKGNVVCSMFRDIEADVYVLADGDMTYPAAQVDTLIEAIVTREADMVVGDRLAQGRYKQENTRRFHNFGNNLVRWAVNKLFGAQLNDIMSGYRAFNRRFVKSMPCRAGGFEIETEMTIHGLDKSLRIVEVPIQYIDRPPGSFSKLNTVRDGTRVLWTIFSLFKNYRPIIFFGSISALLLVAGAVAGGSVVVEFAETRYITHVPLAILSTGLMTFGGLFLGIALILDNVAMNARATCEALLRLVSTHELPKDLPEDLSIAQ